MDAHFNVSPVVIGWHTCKSTRHWLCFSQQPWRETCTCTFHKQKERARSGCGNGVRFLWEDRMLQGGQIRKVCWDCCSFLVLHPTHVSSHPCDSYCPYLCAFSRGCVSRCEARTSLLPLHHPVLSPRHDGLWLHSTHVRLERRHDKTC